MDCLVKVDLFVINIVCSSSCGGG